MLDRTGSVWLHFHENWHESGTGAGGQIDAAVELETGMGGNLVDDRSTVLGFDLIPSLGANAHFRPRCPSAALGKMKVGPCVQLCWWSVAHRLL